MGAFTQDRTHLNTSQEEIDEFLRKGGEIKKYKYGERSETVEVKYGWGKRKKKAAPKKSNEA